MDVYHSHPLVMNRSKTSCLPPLQTLILIIIWLFHTWHSFRKIMWKGFCFVCELLLKVFEHTRRREFRCIMTTVCKLIATWQYSSHAPEQLSNTHVCTLYSYNPCIYFPVWRKILYCKVGRNWNLAWKHLVIVANIPCVYCHLTYTCSENAAFWEILSFLCLFAISSVCGQNNL